ncbi:MAG: hypothetical protein M3422_02755 [Actinomycetota bacterium]|nr:hypothetical protein [Actinomycetota bacterium]
MRRLAGALALVLVLGTGGCRGEGAPGGSGVDGQVDDVESTLDAIESELAGD